jgi:hypothetical protein
MKELLLLAMKQGCKYQLQYSDYEPNQWTAPVLLTEERINQMLLDNSVKEIHIIIKP